MRQIGCGQADIDGAVNENFVYLELRRRTGSQQELAFEMPAFATFGTGELDFFTKSYQSGNVYGIEVKAGKNSGKTVMEAWKKGKVDVVLFVKGNTQGGISEGIYTIPIYGISKFEF